jgi:hypothetical protein
MVPRLSDGANPTINASAFSGFEVNSGLRDESSVWPDLIERHHNLVTHLVQRALLFPCDLVTQPLGKKQRKSHIPENFVRRKSYSYLEDLA